MAPDRGDGDRSIDRREFLRRVARASAAFPIAGPVAGVVLASCSRGTRSAVAARSPSRSPIASLPSGPTFESGRPIERRAVLRVYQWREYLSKTVLDAFERSVDGDVRVEVESFVHMDEAVARLQDPASEFDVFFPTIDALGGLVADGLLRPLNHDLLPNLGNLWPWFRASDGPFYDPGQRYSLPYTVYVSGIGWREDLVDRPDAPDRSPDPFGLFWNERYRGRIGMYDNYLEALSLALVRNGVTDIHRAGDVELARAADALSEAVRLTGVRFTNDGVEEGLPEGEFAAHQAWSGDILAAPRYAADEGNDDVGSRLRFWSPPSPGKVVGCDLMAICTRGRNPDLAHAFLDHLLDVRVALENFAWNGYQPPLAGVTREAFAADPAGAPVPPNLLESVLDPGDLAGGQMLVGFGPTERARWLAHWNRVVPAS